MVRYFEKDYVEDEEYSDEFYSAPENQVFINRQSATKGMLVTRKYLAYHGHGFNIIY